MIVVTVVHTDVEAAVDYLIYLIPDIIVIHDVLHVYAAIRDIN
jgi:hypothetical protein